MAQHGQKQTDRPQGGSEERGRKRGGPEEPTGKPERMAPEKEYPQGPPGSDGENPAPERRFNE